MVIDNNLKSGEDVLEFPPIDGVEKLEIDPDVEEGIVTYREKLLGITKEKPVDFKDIKLIW